MTTSTRCPSTTPSAKSGLMPASNFRTFPSSAGWATRPTAPPLAECPECFGAGLPRTVVKDTRGLGRGALALFGGAKEGKYGTEISLRSQLDVIEKLMRYHGLYQRDTAQKSMGMGHFEVHFIEPPRRSDDPREERA